MPLARISIFSENFLPFPKNSAEAMATKKATVMGTR